MKLFKEHFQSKMGRREVFLSEGMYLYAPVRSRACTHMHMHVHTHTPQDLEHQDAYRTFCQLLLFY